MKLLTVTHFFDSHRGGIEIVAGRLARELGRTGMDVTWLAAGDAAAGARAREPDGIRHVSIAAANFTESMLGFPYPLPSPGALVRIWREAAVADAVLVHDSLYLPCAAACLAAHWHRKPVVIVQHVGAVPYKNSILRHAMAIANRLVARPLLACASQVVFISEITARHFETVQTSRPAEIIFNGVDTTIFRPVTAEAKAGLRRDLGLPANRPVALFVGRFVEKKGIAILQEAARLRPDLTWAFAGWGPLDPRRSGLANVHVLEGLTGKTLAGLYGASDLLVLPSVGEGFPLVIQEALACGLPVICGAETASADEAARALLHAVPLSPGDDDATAHAFAAAVDSILPVANDPEAARQRRTLAIERYSWPSAAASYAAVLHGLFAESGRRLQTHRPSLT